jgi:hypothetical protein
VTRPLTAAERQRLRTTGYLWRALIPLVLIAGLFALYEWLGQPHGSSGIHVIDTHGPIEAARQQAGFPLLVPNGLGNGWRPTSTELTPAAPSAAASFRIGYVTPAGKYAEFLESNDAADAVAAQYGPLSADGTTPVGAAAWSKFQTADGKALLRHTTGSVTVVVSGNAGLAELSQLAASLK